MTKLSALNAGPWALLALALAAASPLAAQTAPPTATAAASEMADGEVRRIDKDNGRITLKHGEIKNLDMPGMTMVFQVKEPALLEGVQVGDKVRFRAEKVPGGYLVTRLQRAP